MAILNYTTKISVRKTAGEIQDKLSRAKAQAVLCEFDPEGLLYSISFRLRTEHGMVSFKLPANHEGVYKRLLNDSRVPRSLKTKEQALRVAWRIVKDWVEAQVAIVEAGVAEITEVFLPYALKPDGKTVYESAKETEMKMIAYNEGQ
jgi:hypothetical protein